MDKYKFNKGLDIRFYRKLVITRLSEKGLTQEDIADVVGCTQGLVSQILQTFESEGYEGLQTKLSFGRPKELTDSDKVVLKEYLSKGATSYGFEDDL